MSESEGLTRRQRIDNQLRSLSPAWEIIPYSQVKDVSSLSLHADEVSVPVLTMEEQLQIVDKLDALLPRVGRID